MRQGVQTWPAQYPHLREVSAGDRRREAAHSSLISVGGVERRAEKTAEVEQSPALSLIESSRGATMLLSAIQGNSIPLGSEDLDARLARAATSPTSPAPYSCQEQHTPPLLVNDARMRGTMRREHRRPSSSSDRGAQRGASAHHESQERPYSAPRQELAETSSEQPPKYEPEAVIGTPTTTQSQRSVPSAAGTDAAREQGAGLDASQRRHTRRLKLQAKRRAAAVVGRQEQRGPRPVSARGAEDETEADKKAERLLRNREAAMRSRTAAKERLQERQRTFRELRDHVDRLERVNSWLKQQLDILSRSMIAQGSGGEAGLTPARRQNIIGNLEQILSSNLVAGPSSPARVLGSDEESSESGGHGENEPEGEYDD